MRLILKISLLVLLAAMCIFGCSSETPVDPANPLSGQAVLPGAAVPGPGELHNLALAHFESNFKRSGPVTDEWFLSQALESVAQTAKLAGFQDEMSIADARAVVAGLRQWQKEGILDLKASTFDAEALYGYCLDIGVQPVMANEIRRTVRRLQNRDDVAAIVAETRERCVGEIQKSPQEGMDLFLDILEHSHAYWSSSGKGEVDKEAVVKYTADAVGFVFGGGWIGCFLCSAFVEIVGADERD